MKMVFSFGTPEKVVFEKERCGELLQTDAYINGKFVKTGSVFQVTNPANAEIIAEVASCGVAETESAIDAAEGAFKTWRKMTPKARGALVAKWGDLITANADKIGAIITFENGKPLGEGKGEANYSASFCEWAAAEGRRVHGETMSSPWSDRRIVTIKQPIGVVGMIAPWNFPAAMIARKVAPAIAVGCTVVIKPAALTPLSALALAKLADQAGIPPGVVNILPTSDELTPAVGETICRSSKVTALSFTGSTRVGKLLLSQCAGTVKKCSMELGGQAPFIVFPSADLDKAVAGLMASKFRNTGQTCVCSNNIMVHAEVHDQFVAKLVQAVKNELKFGDILNGATMGPMINQMGVDKVKRHLEDALEKGAKLEIGGDSLGGLYLQPTVVSNVSWDSLCFKEETFGPLAAIGKFESEETVIDFLNTSRVGLAGYFFSRDAGQVWRVADALEVGMVGANTGMLSCCEAPFGGVKESGLGREGALIGCEEFLETKYICFADC